LLNLRLHKNLKLQCYTFCLSGENQKENVNLNPSNLAKRPVKTGRFGYAIQK